MKTAAADFVSAGVRTALKQRTSPERAGGGVRLKTESSRRSYGQSTSL